MKHVIPNQKKMDNNTKDSSLCCEEHFLTLKESNSEAQEVELARQCFLPIFSWRRQKCEHRHRGPHHDTRQENEGQHLRANQAP